MKAADRGGASVVENGMGAARILLDSEWLARLLVESGSYELVPGFRPRPGMGDLAGAS